MSAPNTRARRRLLLDNDIDASIRLLPAVRDSPTPSTPPEPVPAPAQANDSAGIIQARQLFEENNSKVAAIYAKGRGHRQWAKAVAADDEAEAFAAAVAEYGAPAVLAGDESDGIDVCAYGFSVAAPDTGVMAELEVRAMEDKVEFYYDISSFNAYRASKKIEGLAERNGVKIIYTPFLLGGLFKAMVPDVNYTVETPKGSFTQYGPVPWYRALQCDRKTKAWQFSGRFVIANIKGREGIPIERPLAAGAPAVSGMRLCLAVAEQHKAAICRDIHTAYHVECLDMTKENLAPLAKKFGLEVEAVNDPQVKKALVDTTKRAIQMGAPGTPTFIVQRGDQAKERVMFFGVDRMPLMEMYISGASRAQLEELYNLRVQKSSLSSTPKCE
ncbi:hypothetical protein CYMTET_20629, partial [Cymbomonas tetramitiformis]